MTLQTRILPSSNSCSAPCCSREQPLLERQHISTARCQQTPTIDAWRQFYTKKQGKKTRSDATHQDLEEGNGAIEEQQQKERSEKHKRIAANHHAAEHEQRNEAFVLLHVTPTALENPVDKAPEGIGDQCHRKGVRERTTQVEHQVKLTAAKPHKRMPRSGSILLHQCSAKSVEANEVQHSQHEAHYYPLPREHEQTIE